MDIIFRDFCVSTPLAPDADSLYSSLKNGKSSISPCTRFNVANFACKQASAFEFDVDYPPATPADSLIWKLLEPLRERVRSWRTDYLLLATTKGEIDAFEHFVRNNPDAADKLTLSAFLCRALDFFNIPDGAVVSAACVSSNTAIALAGDMLSADRAERICIIGADIVSLFVYSGFSALQALSAANSAKPFDAERDGLIPGEAAAAILMMKEERNTPSFGRLLGWSSTSDANHVTGPSRDGAMLAESIQRALAMGNLSPADIGGIAAHGTATRYNDAMEMHAFRKVFTSPLPLFSLKGALGHTMGASGILETVIALKSIENGVIPPTAGMTSPDTLAEGWVSSEVQHLENPFMIKTNSGFGGVNATLLLGAPQ